MSEVSPWSVIQSIAERRIEESMAKGDFDDLPGRGKPLELEDDSHVPPELRMAYKVLRNAGCVPPELAERKEISNLADMLEHCEDEQERVRQMQKLRFMILQARMKHQRPLNLDDDTYYDRLLERLSRHDRKKKRLLFLRQKDTKKGCPQMRTAFFSIVASDGQRG